MRMRKHGFIIQLTFLPYLFPVNCYLVEEEHDLTLVDAALPFSVKGILKAAKRLNKPIARIVLTHAHDDHVGALDALKEALPQAQVLISERDAKLLRGDRALEPGEPQTPIRGGVPKAVRTQPDVLLRDGDRVGSLTAISAPGHTPGMMVFLDKRSGALLAGDALQTRGGIAVSGKLKPLFPFPAFATWNKAAALESVRKLRALSPSLLAVGHGAMIADPQSALDRAIREAEQEWGKMDYVQKITR
ncbi:MBL fold metallo-hydrolase [Paenibacillus apiarius]|uniref:MBL fold metallo-hydrolase n=1 Tax=Paenibacillus apiarius TaxID=46240 RepID=UPI003B3AD5F1